MSEQKKNIRTENNENIKDDSDSIFAYALKGSEKLDKETVDILKAVFDEKDEACESKSIQEKH